VFHPGQEIKGAKDEFCGIRSLPGDAKMLDQDQRSKSAKGEEIIAYSITKRTFNLRHVGMFGLRLSVSVKDLGASRSAESFDH